MDTIKFSHAKKPLMVAHKGCSALERENTAAAFVAAGNRSYFGIETDVHRTGDGRYICIHDERTGRVAGDDLPVEQTDSQYLPNLVHRRPGCPVGKLPIRRQIGMAYRGRRNDGAFKGFVHKRIVFLDTLAEKHHAPGIDACHIIFHWIASGSKRDA